MVDQWCQQYFHDKYTGFVESKQSLNQHTRMLLSARKTYTNITQTWVVYGNSRLACKYKARKLNQSYILKTFICNIMMADLCHQQSFREQYDEVRFVSPAKLSWTIWWCEICVSSKAFTSNMMMRDLCHQQNVHMNYSDCGSVSSAKLSWEKERWWIYIISKNFSAISKAFMRNVMIVDQCQQQSFHQNFAQ